MTQTRSFLLFALLAVAYLLWTAWQKDYAPAPAPAPATAATTATADVPAGAPGAAPAVSVQPASAPGQLITVTTDVLRLTIDTRGGSIVRADLLRYPADPPTRREPSPPPVRLFDDSQGDLFLAQSGLVSSQGPAPDHRALFHAAQTRYTLADGQPALAVALTWQDPAGLKVTKTYTLKRGSYVVALDQRIENGSAAAWHGNAYEQLERAARPPLSGWWARFTDPDARSFFGAAWYGPEDKFNTLAFDKFKDDALAKPVAGGWVAMMQHYFFAAWIPPAGRKQDFATAVVERGGDARPAYLIRSLGPQLDVPAGQSASTGARLYVGPKLQGTLDSIAPGLALTSNYGWTTVVAQPLHALLSWLYAVSRNWGVAIILLVLIIKGLTWKLTAAQYRSGAKMRKLQPRIAALKERYGDDKQKMQMAMMELYKKEKVNPMTGCLPVLITIPIFYGLYHVLVESVELRQAPFIGWIHDLSMPDPYFVLPALYTLVMLGQQYLMPPTPGMDPTQAKMMKVMPLLFAVMFAFFPAGLCLYYVINGITGLAQQWYVTRQVEQAQAKARA